MLNLPGHLTFSYGFYIFRLFSCYTVASFSFSLTNSLYLSCKADLVTGNSLRFCLRMPSDLLHLKKKIALLCTVFLVDKFFCLFDCFPSALWIYHSTHSHLSGFCWEACFQEYWNSLICYLLFSFCFQYPLCLWSLAVCF